MHIHDGSPHFNDGDSGDHDGNDHAMSSEGGYFEDVADYHLQHEGLDDMGLDHYGALPLADEYVEHGHGSAGESSEWDSPAFQHAGSGDHPVRFGDDDASLSASAAGSDIDDLVFNLPAVLDHLGNADEPGSAQWASPFHFDLPEGQIVTEESGS